MRTLTTQVNIPGDTFIDDDMHADLRNSRRCQVVYEALAKGLQRA